MLVKKQTFFSFLFVAIAIVLLVVGFTLYRFVFPKAYSLEVKSQISGYSIKVVNEALFKEFLEHVDYKNRRVSLQNQNIHPKKFLVVLTDKEQLLLPNVSGDKFVYASSNMFYNSKEQQLEIYIHLDKKLILDSKPTEEIEERIMMAAIDQLNVFLVPYRRIPDIYPQLHKLKGERKNILYINKS